MDNRKGTILRIERLSNQDGDGLRTVVFFKGCPLRYAWCSTTTGRMFCARRNSVPLWPAAAAWSFSPTTGWGQAPINTWAAPIPWRIWKP